MTLEYVTLLFYFGTLLVLGKLFSRFNSNLSDFIRGGAQGSWWLVGTSMLMAGISAFTFTGNASAAFEAGPTFLVIYVANVCSYLIGFWFLGRWMRQTRAYTVPDVLRARFGPKVEQFFAYTALFLNPIGAAIQLWALAIFASSVFGFPLKPTIIAVGIIVVIYSATGGKWAVMATDFIQGIVMFVITILVGVLALIKVGGLSEFFGYFSDPRFAEDFKFVKEPGAFSGDRFTMKWIVVIFLMQLYVQVGFNSAQRFLSAKDGREAARASLLAAVLMAIGTFVWFLPPMVSRFLYGDQLIAMHGDKAAEMSYAFIARELLPNGLMGIMIAAMFSATMSSMDSGLNEQVGNIARNILPKLRAAFGYARELSDNTTLFICKMLSLGIGALIIIYSLLFSMNQELILFNAYLLIGSIIGIPLTLPTLMGLIFKKMPKWGYWFIMGCTALPSAYSVLDEKLNGVAWTIQTRAMWGFIFGTVASIIAWSLHRYRSRQEKEEVDAFFQLMHTPVDYEKEVGVVRDAGQLLFTGAATASIGGMMFLLLLVPNPLWGRMGILFVAGSTFLLGFGMCLQAKIEARKQAALAVKLQQTEVEG